MNPKELARRVHVDGFVMLPYAKYGASSFIVQELRTQVLRQYAAFLTKADAQNLDLTLRENAERLPGFYVREGGRIDMQLCTVTITTRSSTSYPVQPLPLIDMALLKDVATLWQPVLKELFASDRFYLEYIGCVLSRPGDKVQNWHLDGVHRNKNIHESVDRLNVFVPLVTISDQIGGTEMKARSHIHDNGARGTDFEGYHDLPSVTAHVQAGTPIIMDYRVWHRGVANTSTSTIRPMLYFKYAKKEFMSVPVSLGKRKRITPIRV